MKPHTIARINSNDWLQEHQDNFKPPICIKTMFNSQLTMAFLHGPNVRQDFHVEDGEEIFYMTKGEMNLKIIDNGSFRNIHIKEGELFLLPARVRHSPRRPANTIGFVIERKRAQDKEFDGFLYYDEDVLDPVLEPIHEVYGYIGDDFEKDVHEMVLDAVRNISIGNTTGRSNEPVNRLVLPNHSVKIPEPILLERHIQQNESEIIKNGFIPIFHGQFQSQIDIFGEGKHEFYNDSDDIIFWVYKGNASINTNGKSLELRANDFFLLEAKINVTLLIKPDNFVLRMQMSSNCSG